MIEKIIRLAHDCFRFDGATVVYTDPFQLSGSPKKADIILISHDHYDHCSPDDIRLISKPDTAILAIAACQAKLKALPGEKKIVKPGDRLTVKDVPIEVVPAYNTDKDFHPKKAGHVGYVFTLDGKRIYFAGDTDHIPEMKSLVVDIAFLPVSGTYVMNAEQAAKAAQSMKAGIVVPMHYDAIVGTRADAERFAKLYPGETRIL